MDFFVGLGLSGNSSTASVNSLFGSAIVWSLGLYLFIARFAAFHGHSSLLPYFSWPFISLQFCCSHTQMLKTTLLHESHIFCVILKGAFLRETKWSLLRPNLFL